MVFPEIFKAQSGLRLSANLEPFTLKMVLENRGIGSAYDLSVVPKVNDKSIVFENPKKKEFFRLDY